MGNQSFVDPSFDVKHTSTYYLSIQLALDGFSFCVLDVLSKQFIVFKHKALPNDFENLSPDYYCQYAYDFLQNEKMLRHPYKAISVVYISTLSTLVPITIFDSNKAQLLFEANHGHKANHDILSNRIKNQDLVNIFAIPSCLLRMLSRQFNNFKLYHQTTPLVTTALAHSRQYENGFSLYLNINKKVVDITAINSPHLLLFNSYEYTSNTDIVYYLVNVAEQLQNVGKVNAIIISGDIETENPVHRLIKKYFSTIRLLDPMEGSTVSFPCDFKAKEYLPIFKMHLCE